ncbi:carboxypeptidase Q [Folsomia candida]|uniref:carboxypeptidase Q n=1 Tax=Folsomia candida TaxID=158441 RepID=UPI001604F922|nr:carboxypeptidase Q [Folsomia candida]XP_035711678.1 carboxypeptidase Q [Folsomia candida]
MFYEGGSLPIPSAEISIEDADLLYRLYKKGEKVEVHFKLLNEHVGNITTRNSIGDYIGSSKPDEFVLIGGHVDSLDAGQGALDDGYRVILSLYAVQVLQRLGLRPRRSIRTIIWSAEEVGRVPLGAKQYLENHLDELKTKYSIFQEADSGIFDANGLIFNGTSEAGCIMAEILKLLEPEVIPETKLVQNFSHLKTDIVPLMQATGVPGAVIAANADKYFWYHHSNADTVTAIDSKDMDVCLALWTAVSFVLADLEFMLPRMSTNVAGCPIKGALGGNTAKLNFEKIIFE